MAEKQTPFVPPTLDADGIRKAAIFLISVDQESAARILTQLEKSEQEALALEIARLGEDRPTREERDKILKEFHTIHMAREYVEQGGVGYARSLLEKILPTEEVRKIIDMIESSMKMTPFGFLQKTDTENLVTFIQEEHPQTISLILAYLSPAQSSEILEGLPLKKQQEVVKRLATMEHTSPEVVHQVEKALENKLSAFFTQELRKTGGVEAAAEILNMVQRQLDCACHIRPLSSNKPCIHHIQE